MLLVVQFIKLLISGVSNAFSFLVMLPEILISSLAIVPTPLTTVLFTCFGIILAVRVLELLP